MQNSEITKLFDAIELLFSDAYITILDKCDTVVLENQNRALCGGIPLAFNGYKEIKTLEQDGGKVFYMLSFPLHSSNQLFIILPSDSKTDILMAAKMADSLIQIADSKPAFHTQVSRQSNMTLLLDHLLHPDSSDDYTYTALLAAELGLDMSISRAVCIFHLEFPDESPKRKAEISYSIAQTIRHFSIAPTQQEIIGSFTPSDIILCHAVKSEDSSRQYLESLHHLIENKYHVTCTIAVGLTVNSLSEYPSSLYSARSVFHYAIRDAEKSSSIYYVNDFLVEQFVFQIPKETFEHFFQNELNYVHSNETALETIKALVENDMELIPAAESLYIHRNTMIFRLNQLKKHLKLNPLHNDSDRFRLILFYHYYIRIRYQNGSPRKYGG